MITIEDKKPASTIHRYSCADTAKMLRKALKEAFPDVKFGVRSRTYAGGASIDVEWTDGVNADQVAAITAKFEASYFDGTIDYKGAIYHMVEGKEIRFGADFISCNRRYTEEAIQRAIDLLYSRHAVHFEAAGRPKPTVQMYRDGSLYSCVFIAGDGDLFRLEMHRYLCKVSDRIKGFDSKTAGKVFATRDDGYSRQFGEGFSAVSC